MMLPALCYFQRNSDKQLLYEIDVN